MKTQTKVGIAVWLLLLGSSVLIFSSDKFTRIADAALLVVLLVAMLGGSIYKIWLWWGYRNDPAKRQTITFSTQLYPEKLRRFLMDEQHEGDKKETKG
jgi:hypothetical protein